jgi:hypothetical protein
MWGATNPDYTKWFKHEWNEKPSSDFLGEVSDWNIEGWSRRADQHYRLRNRADDVQEWRAFLTDAERAGFPFLERISTWRGAADHLRSERWHFDRSADFLLIAGDPEGARATLLEGIETFEVAKRADNFNELPRIKQRLERYFGSTCNPT